MDNEIKEENVENFLGQLNKLNQIVNSFKTSCKITSYCFDKCVTHPEKSLSSSNKKCIWNCTQRYIESDYFIKERAKENVNNFKFKLTNEMEDSLKIGNLKNEDTSYILKD